MEKIAALRDMRCPEFTQNRELERGQWCKNSEYLQSRTELIFPTVKSSGRQTVDKVRKADRGLVTEAYTIQIKELGF